MIAEPVVYVVDDDPAMIRLLAELVKAIGLNVEAYQSAEEFLEAYQASRAGLPGARCQGSGHERHGTPEATGCRREHAADYLHHGPCRRAHGGRGDGARRLRVSGKALPPPGTLREDPERGQAGRGGLALPGAARTPLRRLAQLTPAERKVADRLIAGKTNKMIAEELGLSVRTVEAQRARLMERLGMRSRAELVSLVAAAEGECLASVGSR